MDAVTENAAFRNKFDFPFQLLSDESRSVCLAFGAVKDVRDQYAQRYTFVIGPDGIIEHAMAADDPGGQAALLLEVMAGGK